MQVATQSLVWVVVRPLGWVHTEVKPVIVCPSVSALPPHSRVPLCTAMKLRSGKAVLMRARVKLVNTCRTPRLVALGSGSRKSMVPPSESVTVPAPRVKTQAS